MGLRLVLDQTDVIRSNSVLTLVSEQILD